MTHIPQLAVYPKFNDVSLYTRNSSSHVHSLLSNPTERGVRLCTDNTVNVMFFTFVIFFNKPRTVHRRAHQSITQNAHIIIHNHLYMKKKLFTPWYYKTYQYKYIMRYIYTKLIRRIDPFQRVFPEIIDPKKSFDLGPIIVILSRSIHRVSLSSENSRRFPFTNVYYNIFFYRRFNFTSS